jgi:hypothetical protein
MLGQAFKLIMNFALAIVFYTLSVARRSTEDPAQHLDIEQEYVHLALPF